MSETRLGECHVPIVRESIGEASTSNFEKRTGQVQLEEEAQNSIEIPHTNEIVIKLTVAYPKCGTIGTQNSSPIAEARLIKSEECTALNASLNLDKISSLGS